MADELLIQSVFRGVRRIVYICSRFQILGVMITTMKAKEMLELFRLVYFDG